LSSHPPFRLRLTLAALILAVVGTTVGAAALLGSNQEAPTTLETAAIAPTGPPLLGDPDPAPDPVEDEPSGPRMRLGVLDKGAAIEEQRQAEEARALREYAAAQDAAIAEYADALATARAAAEEPPPSSAPPPPPSTPPPPVPNDDGGGGGSLYAKLDNIATCESGRNPRAFNPQGPWYGAFQFRKDTWRSSGGGPGDIRDYSYTQQREIAANLARARGFAGSWPSCAAQYGYA
jgi:hypothetical protein